MAKINYADKVALNLNSGIADINKCNATDMNEIKSVVNENDTRLSIVETNQGTLANLITYSTDEQVIGTWMGKPLYRKSFYRASLIAGTSQTVQHGISNVDKIWLDPSSSIVMWQNGNSTSLPFINQDIYANSIFVYDIGPTYYFLKSAIDRSSLTGYLTFNYTKTTD